MGYPDEPDWSTVYKSDSTGGSSGGYKIALNPKCHMEDRLRLALELSTEKKRYF